MKLTVYINTNKNTITIIYCGQGLYYYYYILIYVILDV